MRRAVLLGALAIPVVGCPDNPSTTEMDMAVSIDDMAISDGGGDGGGCTDGTACMVGGKAGLCKSGACAACADPADDPACHSAYGSTTATFVCAAGECKAGCRTSATCGAKVCGATTANQCGNCTTDVQCQMMVNANTMCEISTGNCILNACTNPGAACAANPADICCASSAANQCYAGSCCSNSDCGDAGKNCVNHTCTTCPAPTGNTRAVDPSEIPGGPATGADVTGCRYKTITAAIAAPRTAGVVYTIKVMGTREITGTSACNDSAIECFPILVPENVMVVGDATMPPTVIVDTNGTGFELNARASGISNITVDGQAGRLGNIGVDVMTPPTPSPTPAPFIDHVTLKRFDIAGVHVEGGSLDIKGGSTFSDSGAGMGFDTGLVTVTGGPDPISVLDNGTGVEINDATVTMTGTVTNATTGTIMIKNNLARGLVTQSSAKAITLTGVVFYNNGFGASLPGLDVNGPVVLKLRQCSVLKSGGSGILVKGDPAGTNLGSTGDFGHNTFQATGGDANGQSGICLTAAGVLPAQGNIFRGVDCSVSTGPINFETVCTGAGVDVAATAGSMEINICNSN